jgi:aerobic-type carbon monoxide dehydrogenase small subunit (CoxS/CutS family)
MTLKQGASRKSTSVARNRPEVQGPGKAPVQLLVNGKVHNLEVEPRRTLLDVLREDLHLTGTKKGCDMGECGACTVVLDGQAVYSCLVLAIECQGHQILTIEGLSEGTELDPVQQAFINQDAFQCGFCTPGQIMTAYALLKSNPRPSSEEIRQAMAGNICRCGSYARILAAVESAANNQDKSPRP